MGLGDETLTETARSDAVTVTFHGVRGSTPCHAPELVRYGGNTSCVSLDVAGADPILFDLGTGLRYFGNRLAPGAPFVGTCLLSHLHWDHIQGLPFFAPLLQERSNVILYGPEQEGNATLSSVFAETICPPLFPVDLAKLPGAIEFVECWESSFQLRCDDSPIEVMSRPIPHVGNTVGYRVTAHGRSVAYLSDHQMPIDGSLTMSPGARELCAGADLVIHDAQYTPIEFARKSDWGHCTIEYAVWVAAEAGAKRLALFHHDPSHHDDMLDRLAEEAAVCGREFGVDVFAAREGDTVEV